MMARVCTAIVTVPIVILLIWLGDLFLTLGITALGVVGALEVCRLARARGLKPFSVCAGIWAGCCVVFVHGQVASVQGQQIILFSVVLAALLGAVTLFLRREPGKLEVNSFVATAVAAFYPAAPLSLVLLVRDLVQGFEWVILLVAVTFIADSTALILGKSFGRHLLAHAISPAKTWEGAVGNLLAAITTTVAVVVFLSLGMSFLQAILLGTLLGVAGQIGDLVESAAKRWAGVKDSGSLLPGHGGVLDRLDSIVFNIPLVYYFSIWVAT